jgi:cell wall-associated NlpC family hydrolase
MRCRIALAVGIVAVIGVASGCGSSDDARTAAATRLAGWEFPRQLFIPQVSAAAPAPKVRAQPSAKRTAAPDAPATDVSPGAPTDAEIRAQLRELYDGSGSGSTGDDLANRVSLAGGLAFAPPDAPDAVQAIVAAANQVARLPYVYGGGHGVFVDSAYDCSGSVAFALANAGLIDATETSGQLMSWGRPGPGRWVTVYANDGHAFMVVGGARFDTVGLRETGSRWQQPHRTIAGFTARHPPGL